MGWCHVRLDKNLIHIYHWHVIDVAYYFVRNSLVALLACVSIWGVIDAWANYNLFVSPNGELLPSLGHHVLWPTIKSSA